MEPEHPVGNWQKHNVDDSLLTTVGSLLEDETYTVRVLAFTSVGDGPLSDPIQVKTQQGVPGQPMNLRAEAKSETSIRLSWSPPRQESVIKRPQGAREVVVTAAPTEDTTEPSSWPGAVAPETLDLGTRSLVAGDGVVGTRADASAVHRDDCQGLDGLPGADILGYTDSAAPGSAPPTSSQHGQELRSALLRIGL
ncbi:Receptor-type tyrosine-protein phosphatase S [Fukomys damarensis]|uniref:Receptor-type tyrosine-protein phosphatase S n=1 Tax=Fukomys damarensis TaxID=885580 RepID=A0A091E179_FUKDA|nr:Receptor-type tyrosine-protein phosphatase S [Fukomys damarensis]